MPGSGILIFLGRDFSIPQGPLHGCSFNRVHRLDHNGCGVQPSNDSIPLVRQPSSKTLIRCTVTPTAFLSFCFPSYSLCTPGRFEFSGHSDISTPHVERPMSNLPSRPLPTASYPFGRKKKDYVICPGACFRSCAPLLHGHRHGKSIRNNLANGSPYKRTTLHLPSFLAKPPISFPLCLPSHPDGCYPTRNKRFPAL